MSAQDRIENALVFARRYGEIDGGHHKAWVIDQMVMALTGCPLEKVSAVDTRNQQYEYDSQGKSEEYLAFVAAHNSGEYGPNTYEWDEGVAP